MAGFLPVLHDIVLSCEASPKIKSLIVVISAICVRFAREEPDDANFRYPYRLWDCLRLSKRIFQNFNFFMSIGTKIEILSSSGALVFFKILQNFPNFPDFH